MTSCLLTSSLLLDGTRSTCLGSSVNVKDTTEFLSFPSCRTCLRWNNSRWDMVRLQKNVLLDNNDDDWGQTLTIRWGVDRELPQTGNKGCCCREVVWWQSTVSSQQRSGLWMSVQGDLQWVSHVHHALQQNPSPKATFGPQTTHMHLLCLFMTCCSKLSWSFGLRQQIGQEIVGFFFPCLKLKSRQISDRYWFRVAERALPTKCTDQKWQPTLLTL